MIQMLQRKTILYSHRRHCQSQTAGFRFAFCLAGPCFGTRAHDRHCICKENGHRLKQARAEKGRERERERERQGRFLALQPPNLFHMDQLLFLTTITPLHNPFFLAELLLHVSLLAVLVV